MKNKKWFLIGGLLVVMLAVGVVGATNVLAQGPTDAPLHGGHGPGSRGLGGVELEAAAKALGMTTDEVTAALQSGQTLQDLAEKAGVDMADVQAAIQAAHETEMRDRIQQAVDDGTITQANADWLLEGLDKGYIGGPGGFGFGHGPKGDGQLPFNPQNQSDGG